MDEPSASIIVAIVGVIGSVLVGIISAFTTAYTVNKQNKKEQENLLDEMDKNIAIISVKVDTLWDIYAKDAIREAKKSGLVKENSPLAVTEVARNLFTDSLLAKIEEDVSALKRQGRAKDACIEVINKHMDELILVSIEGDVSLHSVTGVVRLICETQKE